MGDEAPLTRPRGRSACDLACAAALGALLVVPAAFAQPAAPIADARAALRAGRPERTLSLLGDAASPEALRLRVLAAAQLRRIDLALDAYAARMASEPSHDTELLKAIAEGYLAQYPPADARAAAIARCEREVAVDVDPEAPRRPARASSCLSDMKAISDDVTAAPATRGAAALVLVQAGDATAGARITGLAVTPIAAERRALLPILERAPAAVALPVLMAFLDDDDLGIEHQAAAAMGAFPTDESKLALKGYLAINFRRIARAPTVVSLATMGDAEALRELRGLLPQLTGLELVNGAAALAAINDPRGVEALERAAQGESDQLRALAGAKLAVKRPGTARAVFERGMGHPAAAVRRQTLDAYAATPLADESRLLALLRDRDATVRARAAELLLRRH